MKAKEIPFQQIALNKLRLSVAKAMDDYCADKTPQVVSYTAPTGAGKTIIMASLIERIYQGDEHYMAQPEAIFVWLSDSPELNQQSKDKIDIKADRILLSQTVTITEDSFNKEILEDGFIYFLNTQKLGKNCNLTKHSDDRQWTIWETLANTVQEKSNHLYFIIDEAHRGMRDNQAARATTIMQKFLKGSEEDGVPQMPVVIGITATPERFNRLVDGLGSTTIRKVVTTAEEVCISGLLKDRIVIEYPDTLNNEMAVLQAAADEWHDKVLHWEQYCRDQHYAYVNPILVIQVQNGSAGKTSDTDLDECLHKIEERLCIQFQEGEVVHTFGQTSSILNINGLPVHYEEPSRITGNRKIKVVFFKENLSTGWDCPRAETMMSFRRANDSTYIAQLLGRMVRTPMGMHIQVDETLNDVRLFLPYFNSETVKQVVEELHSVEGGNLPTDVVGQSIGERKVEMLSVKQTKNKSEAKTSSIVSQVNYKPESNTSRPTLMPLFTNAQKSEEVTTEQALQRIETAPEQSSIESSFQTQQSDNIASMEDYAPLIEGQENSEGTEFLQNSILDREAIIKAINEIGLLTYEIRRVRISNYLKSLFDLSRLLTCTRLDPQAYDNVLDHVVNKVRSFVEELKENNKYDELSEKVMQFKLNTQTIDVFGNAITENVIGDLFSTTDVDIDRQFSLADSKLGNEGIGNRYGKSYYDVENPNAYKIDIILFTADTDQLVRLESYAKDEFHRLADNFRLRAIGLEEKHKKIYNDIVSNGDIVSVHSFQLPEIISAIRDLDGKNYPNHLYLNGEGEAWIKLNSWEEGVINEEASQRNFVCWLRNQPRKPWALTIPYKMDGREKPAYPDFIVITTNDNGGYIIDILEPHDPSRNDNLPKAKGFAEYANKNPEVGRLQLIRKVKDVTGNRYKRLDLTKGLIRQRVLAATTNEELNHIFETDGEYMGLCHGNISE